MAIRTAFDLASGSLIFVFDADYTYRANCIPKMVELLEIGHDAVQGSRLRGQKDPCQIEPAH